MEHSDFADCIYKPFRGAKFLRKGLLLIRFILNGDDILKNGYLNMKINIVISTFLVKKESIYYACSQNSGQVTENNVF
jgi:hypothetical protein